MALITGISRPGAATTGPRVPQRRRIVAAVCVLALALAGCGAADDADAPTDTTPSAPVDDAAPQPPGTAESAPPALIMATTTIWADVARNVACGGLAEVESILPSLADPHDFEPSMSDRARLDDAELIVANGLELEERLEDTLVSVEADGTAVFYAGDYMTTLEFDAETFGGHHDAEDEEQDGEEDGEGTRTRMTTTTGKRTTRPRTRMTTTTGKRTTRPRTRMTTTTKGATAPRIRTSGSIPSGLHRRLRTSARR